MEYKKGPHIIHINSFSIFVWWKNVQVNGAMCQTTYIYVTKKQKFGELAMRTRLKYDINLKMIDSTWMFNKKYLVKQFYTCFLYKA